MDLVEILTISHVEFFRIKEQIINDWRIFIRLWNIHFRRWFIFSNIPCAKKDDNEEKNTEDDNADDEKGKPSVPEKWGKEPLALLQNKKASHEVT